jgi:glycosyltransferase involved in cell wall biosynthesis
MLRVLQLIPTLDRSGAEKQMVLLAAGLPRDRFAVEVAALTRLGPLAEELQQAGIPVTLIGKRHKADPFTLARLASFLRKKRFDVLQTWIFAANTYGRVAARMAAVPVVVTAEMAVDLWKSPGHLAIDRRLARRTDRVVGNSQAVVDFYRDRAGVPSHKLEMIASGIADLDAPATTFTRDDTRRRLNVPEGAPVALFAGRLAPQKAVDVLLKAIDVLSHVRPDLITLIAGDGPQRDRLEEMARAFDLVDTGRARFLGHRDDVPDLIEACDLLVLPSRFEGLPNVVLEAMQRGKAVVATAAPGTTEIVSDGETGLLVPLDNPTELARAIRRVIEGPDLARSLGAAGRDRVASSFRADAMIQRFADLYEELARSKGILTQIEVN